MTLRGPLVVGAVLVALGPAARAERWQQVMERMHGGALLHYELTGLTSIAEPVPQAQGQAQELVLAGARIHGFIATNARVALHVGVDLAFGATVQGGGFAYDVAMFPVGLVVRGGATAILGVAAGVGFMGATGTIDDAVTLPLEAIAEVGGGRLRLLARGRVAWVDGAPARRAAASSLGFADELDAMVGLRLGRHYEAHGFPSGNGYFVGASYRELAGARMLGVTIGYSIDLATPRR